MNTYTTSDVAKVIGIHPNTVRMYEEWGLIPLAERKSNGYRIFTDFHIEQLRLARIAFQIEVLQNGLRKKVVEIIKLSAKRDFDRALMFAEEYRSQIQREQRNAEESIGIAKQILSGKSAEHTFLLKRKEVSDYLDISMDTLRNWERNGLLQIKRKQNGYRSYTSDDIERLKMIRTLRLANYSLEAILRMLNALEHNPQIDMKQVLNTPQTDSDIVSVCDRLIVSLKDAEENAEKMITILLEMKEKFS
ncbi:MAG: MerR family transcriptional regulator [Lachnospiraceae bacterium]|nr:MerR family transcriptional regulator [Lachnospiraceae bacterium]